MDESETPFGEALGKQLKRRRTELGLTQDLVAIHSRGLGLGFTRSVVAQIEAGRRDLTLPELAIVLAILDTDLPSVLGGCGVMELVEGRIVADGDALAAGLVGDRPLDAVIETSPALVHRMLAANKELKRETEAVWPRARIADVVAAERAIGEAEAKAGRRLGVSARSVSLAAHRAWGRSLSAERDARVSERAPNGAAPESLQRIRGHVTRQLQEELRPALERARRR
jgi:transcriptional regulator with XRE-family HTH domain